MSHLLKEYHGNSCLWSLKISSAIVEDSFSYSLVMQLTKCCKYIGSLIYFNLSFEKARLLPLVYKCFDIFAATTKTKTLPEITLVLHVKNQRARHIPKADYLSVSVSVRTGPFPFPVVTGERGLEGWHTGDKG